MASYYVTSGEHRDAIEKAWAEIRTLCDRVSELEAALRNAALALCAAHQGDCECAGDHTCLDCRTGAAWEAARAALKGK